MPRVDLEVKNRDGQICKNRAIYLILEINRYVTTISVYFFIWLIYTFKRTVVKCCMNRDFYGDTLQTIKNNEGNLL